MPSPAPLSVYLLTDIPVWTRSLETALRERGAVVHVGADLASAQAIDVVVNRLSNQLLQIRDLDHLLRSLRDWESEGRPVLNGADCLEIGLSKKRQHDLFQACGVRTPETALATAGQRAFPDQTVILKPAAGGFGKGIRRLAPGEPLPLELEPAHGWIEQVAVEPADGMVHRIELVGDRLLYDAATPFEPDCFDYCLAHAGEASTLLPAESIQPEIGDAVLGIAARAGMQLGAIEYFRLEDGSACFFDLNPVSSLHRKARELLGIDPIAITAEQVLRAARSGPSRTSP